MSRDDLLQHLGRYNDVVEIFHRESDRAAAILAGSYLEVLLEKLLASRFIANAPSKEVLTGNGPLSTFSSRILVSYSLGFIDQSAYNDLNLVRRIRNHFAHNIESASFEEDTVRDRCAAFSLVRQTIESGQADYLPKDARSRFLLSVGMLTLSLTQNVHEEWLRRPGAAEELEEA